MTAPFPQPTPTEPFPVPWPNGPGVALAAATRDQLWRGIDTAIRADGLPVPCLSFWDDAHPPMLVLRVYEPREVDHWALHIGLRAGQERRDGATPRYWTSSWAPHESPRLWWGWSVSVSCDLPEAVPSPETATPATASPGTGGSSQ